MSECYDSWSLAGWDCSLHWLPSSSLSGQRGTVWAKQAVRTLAGLHVVSGANDLLAHMKQ